MNEKDEQRELMAEFVGAVNGLLKRHEAINRIAENLKLEHENVKKVTEW
jgi:hypothetical protein